MSKALHTVTTALAMLMAGTKMPAHLVPRSRGDGKRRSTTEDLVVCRTCGAECEATKSCSAKAHAISIGWKKIDDRSFDCPACRETP